MLPKHLLLACFSFVCLNQSSQAQLLKKIKDKVNKTINNEKSGSEKEEENKTSSDNSSSNTTKDEDHKSSKWCDGLEAAVSGSGTGSTSTKDGVEYKKIFSSSVGFTILYDESSLKLNNDSKGHRLVLSEKVNNKTQFKLVENGKVVATSSTVEPKWLSKSGSQTGMKNPDEERQAAMSKYIVGDTMKQNIPKSDAKTVTVQKTDDEQMEMVLNIARQTDDYKSMSDEEKKEFEESIKSGIAKNNSMAGTTYNVPAQQGGTVAMVNGYFVVVKGKKYGKFMMPPVVEVSADETKVFAVGLNEQSKPVMIANGKMTPLDPDKYAAMGGRIVRSPDQNKFVYLEQKKMSEKELQEYTSTSGSTRRPIQYNVINSDGSSLTVADLTYSGKFRLTNSGALVYLNEETGEVLADNKTIGKFASQGNRIDPDAVLVGSDISKIAYYNGSEGSLTYLDGEERKLDIIYPSVVSDGGKSYLSWFRKCGNDIYIARFIY